MSYLETPCKDGSSKIANESSMAQSVRVFETREANETGSF
jgi:hypothetical protein